MERARTTRSYLAGGLEPWALCLLIALRVTQQGRFLV